MMMGVCWGGGVCFKLAVQEGLLVVCLEEESRDIITVINLSDKRYKYICYQMHQPNNKIFCKQLLFNYCALAFLNYAFLYEL